MVKYWGVSLGEGGKYVEEAKKGNYIAIGWEKLGDASWLISSGSDTEELWESFQAEFKELFPGSPVKTGIGAGQFWKFVVEMVPGDIALVRDPLKRMIHIARVTGEYKYEESPDDDCHYRHRREVSWLKQVSRDDLPQKLKDSMGALLTIFKVNKHGTEIERLISGDKTPTRSKILHGEELRKGVIQRMLDFSPVEFEEFITDLLSTLGFETTKTTLVGDKGVDVVGALNAEDLANINLHVQVKRFGGGSIGIDEVLKIRGTLGLEDQGALITTSKYTKQAQQEAQGSGKKPIALVDGIMLVDLVLKHFEELSPKFQEFLRLERKNIPVEELFILRS